MVYLVVTLSVLHLGKSQKNPGSLIPSVFTKWIFNALFGGKVSKIFVGGKRWKMETVLSFLNAYKVPSFVAFRLGSPQYLCSSHILSCFSNEAWKWSYWLCLSTYSINSAGGLGSSFQIIHGPAHHLCSTDRIPQSYWHFSWPSLHI